MGIASRCKIFISDDFPVNTKFILVYWYFDTYFVFMLWMAYKEQFFSLTLSQCFADLWLGQLPIQKFTSVFHGLKNYKQWARLPLTTRSNSFCTLKLNISEIQPWFRQTLSVDSLLTSLLSWCSYPFFYGHLFLTRLWFVTVSGIRATWDFILCLSYYICAKHFLCDSTFMEQLLSDFGSTEVLLFSLLHQLIVVANSQLSFLGQ